MTRDVIALVGGGHGGHALLMMLSDMPSVEVRCVYDIRPNAPGMVLARELGIECLTDPDFSRIAGNAEINLILEVTGLPEVFEKLGRIKSPRTSLIGAEGNRIVFTMLETQEQAKRRLDNLRVTLEERVASRTSDLEDANRRLEEKVRAFEALSEKLQQVNDQKTRYLLRSTHQLKAPFAAIQHYTDLIIHGYAGATTEKTLHIASKIKARCDLLSASIKAMLQLANLKSCVTENLEFTIEDLNELLGAAVAAINAPAKRAGVDVAFTPTAEPVNVRCNRTQLGMLFSALLENAVTYSHRDSEVKISVTVSGGRVAVAVKDHGIGISEKNIPRVFDEYFRANRAVEHHPDGTGMGLAIVKEIAAIHGLDVNVASPGEGLGSTFTVTMPLAAPALE
ncbi:MAG: HAMP domain-containing histidine kinase [Lentisphaerae bacterium]|nr:HAMP domain-containing histidine kinase [Lentisphaerota bacterium]